MKPGKILFYLIIAVSIWGCAGVVTVDEEVSFSDERLIEDLKKKFEEKSFSFFIPPTTRVDSVIIDSLKKKINIKTNKGFSYRPFREKDIDTIYSELKKFFARSHPHYSVSVESIGHTIEDLIPNFYREKLARDWNRKPGDFKSLQVVKNISKPYKITKGLQDRNIAMWHSHGWYYNHKLDRWLWQRARLFQIVEDIGPLAFVIPYLTPMLENAGANVYLPRERDHQIHEVVIDNDMNTESYIEESFDENYIWQNGAGIGFKYGTPPYDANYNPFEHGTHRIVKSGINANARASYIPIIPEEGEYAVYISYKASEENVNNAHYTVYHLGGKTEFAVNQQIGGSTWFYLGKFKFASGKNPGAGKVVIENNSSTPGKIVSTDAVRFGGGAGIVKRNGNTSGRPKFVEGARYWLQYAGMPDTLVYNLNSDADDYKDDYQSRAEWVNYLAGAPAGPNKNRNEKGLGIPIDISLSFHTDAGITHNDTVVGTLAIYSYPDLDSNFIFPQGYSRIANRDLTDILQTQIVNDIKEKYDSIWNRRYLWDQMYSEAARPNVPAVLLELLSHQNFLDNKFQLDPLFRFDVSRSIYKAFLRFLSAQYNFDYVVQPLPPDNFAAVIENGSIRLTWQPVIDPIEPDAVPTGYVVYKRNNGDGFDNGVFVNSNEYVISDYSLGDIYSFKVTAVNEGGESFPTEILSVCQVDNDSKPILIVNAFDRVSSAASVSLEGFEGFADFIDQGVPDKIDLSYVGSQYNFTPSSKWATDDTPGHGSSYANYETKVIAGNSFDFPFIHGSAIKANGFSFVSTSDEAVMNNHINMNDYNTADLIFGEEKETSWQKSFADSLHGIKFKAFPEKMKIKIEEFLAKEKNLFLSGSYIGTELFAKKTKEHPDRAYAADVLKYKLDSQFAVKEGRVFSIDNDFLPKGYEFEFETQLNDSIYAAEAPDALGAVNGGKTIFRYSENHFSAAVAYGSGYKTVAFGFPFETIKNERDRILVMKSILNFFNK